MDQDNEFRHWLNISLGQVDQPDESHKEVCGCGNWDCEKCFPEDENGHDGVESSLEFSGSPSMMKREDEIEECGINSPLTYAEQNLDEENWYEPSHEDLNNDAGDMVDSILSMQNMGLTNSDRMFSHEELTAMAPDELENIYSQVMGEISESGTDVKNKLRRNPLDDLDDVLNPPEPDLPVNVDADDGDFVLPVANSAETRRRAASITPTDQMRDYINRINFDATGEPDLPQPAGDELVVRTAQDIPAVISNAISQTGATAPEWHHIRDLPGFNDRMIRAMGRQMFGMFTRTPVEEIKTIANVNGQGPNSESEVNRVARWLRDHAEFVGDIDLDFGNAIPGYKPEVLEYTANGTRFQVVRDHFGKYIYAYPESDATNRYTGRNIEHDADTNDTDGDTPMLREGQGLVHAPTLFERLHWDDQLREIMESLDEDITLDESTLSRKLGKQPGGQKLVQWLHRRHKLSNDAELEPVPFKERIFWKQFKSNPDDFVIVTAETGVAGIKPSEEYIKHMQEKFAKKGKTYNPSGDANLLYQAIAFKDDGRQIDPKLLQPKEEPEDDASADRFITSDPTVIKARMGIHSGRDTQNPNNVFNLIADELGPLQTVWISGFENVKDAEAGRGSVEREKMAARKELGASHVLPAETSLEMIFKRVRPVLKNLAHQAMSQINRSAQRYINGGNFEAAQKVAAQGQQLKKFLITLDTEGNIALSRDYNSTSKEFTDTIIRAAEQASESREGTPEFDQWLNDAAKGNSVALKPLLDALREKLVSL